MSACCGSIVGGRAIDGAGVGHRGQVSIANQVMGGDHGPGVFGVVHGIDDELANMVVLHCGVPYTETSLFRSYGIVVRYLNRVGLRGEVDTFQCPPVAAHRPRD
jgi:hypothetical protein